MQSIEWRPVVGYEGRYEVSDDGRVRSLSRVVMRSNGAPQSVRARELIQCDFKGYRAVNLAMNGSAKVGLVHRLVASAFIGKGEIGQEVCHGDGTRTNNNASNLRWGSRSDNMQDALRHGTHYNASRDSCIRGHEFTAENTRHYGTMRICITCRKRKVDCTMCGRPKSYYGMKSHLLWVHHIEGDVHG